MGMENKGHIDIVERPSLMLTPGYEKAEDIASDVSAQAAIMGVGGIIDNHYCCEESSIGLPTTKGEEITFPLEEEKVLSSYEIKPSHCSDEEKPLDSLYRTDRSYIDVVTRPSIILPGQETPIKPSIVLPTGYQKVEDISPAIDKTPPVDHEDEAMKSLFEKFDASKSDSIGWVQKHEVNIAKKRIRESLGFEPIPMAGFYMAVAVHENDGYVTINGRKTNIVRPESAKDEDKFRNPTGLVISQGPWCYQGEHFKEPILEKICRFFFGRWMEPSRYRPWCRVGDYVVMPRHEGQMVNYRGIPVMMIRDTKIYSPIENPEYVKREF